MYLSPVSLSFPCVTNFLQFQEILKKCQRCMEVIIDAKERQAAEANKNATILLQEIDQEKVSSILITGDLESVHVDDTIHARDKTQTLEKDKATQHNTTQHNTTQLRV